MGAAELESSETNWDPSRPGHTLLELLSSEILANGEVTEQRLGEIAEIAGTTRAKVRGVLGYYSDLKPDSSTVRVCMGEACRARGAAETVESLTENGEKVGILHCAGLCTTGPTVIREQHQVIPVSREGGGTKIHLSLDSISLSLGAEMVALSLLEHLPDDASLIRTGSRGLFDLEPMVEVASENGRLAFGPMTPEDIPSLVNAMTTETLDEHPKALGLVDKIDRLSIQTRYATSRLGVAAPLDIDGQRAAGAYVGLEKARQSGPEVVLTELHAAGLRGRGGAGFPTHFKWRAAMNEPDPVKHVVANADEGDAGTFIDRMLIEGDPHGLIEGMLICAEVIGARSGWVYLRGEYPNADRILHAAIESAREEGLLGDHFDITVAKGAGSYVCGEETALLESLEGRRGEVRARPPFPTTSGLYGHPTIVNNVLTFAMAAAVMREGGETIAQHGSEASRGTVVAQISGDVSTPVCIEVPFGGTVSEMFEAHSSLDGVTAVQIGGPLGGVFRTDELGEIELSFEGLATAGGLLGHGGFVCYGGDFDARAEVIDWMRFFRDESCGKCTPCRLGTQRALELLERIGTEGEKNDDRVLLDSLDEVMTSTSLCALGGLAMNPVRSTMARWPDAFRGGGDD